jgi:hypothetical protein
LAHATTLKGADQRLAATADKPVRILLVDAILALHESHLLLLRSIPAIVKILASCADMYLHEENDYALVILILNSESRIAAEAAHFVRRRWVAARILLLEDGYTTIDDWLYDERVDPRVDPMTVLETAVRLMTDRQYSSPA